MPAKENSDADAYSGSAGDDGFRRAGRRGRRRAPAGGVGTRLLLELSRPEYQNDSNKGMSGRDFTSLIASVCPSERQNFRVTLVDFPSLQFPNVDSGAHMTTANNAIAAAQKDVVTAFINHKAAAK